MNHQVFYGCLLEIPKLFINKSKALIINNKPRSSCIPFTDMEGYGNARYNQIENYFTIEKEYRAY